MGGGPTTHRRSMPTLINEERDTKILPVRDAEGKIKRRIWLGSKEDEELHRRGALDKNMHAPHQSVTKAELTLLKKSKVFVAMVEEHKIRLEG